MEQQTTTTRRPPRPLRRHYSPWRLVRANLYDLALLLRDSYLALAGFSLVVLAGALYFALHDGLVPSLAVYEALKLLIFQSSQPLPENPVGIALFFIAPLLGVVLIAQSVIAFGRRLLDKGSRRETWQVALAATYADHVIVCGLGRVGLRVALRLVEAGYDVVVIERDWSKEHVARALSLKIPVVLGDAREYPILRQARVMRARAVVAVINGDLLDIEIALAARALRPEIPVVLRAFDEELDANLERVFGTNSAFSTSALAAPTFAAAAVSRGIDHVLPPGDGHEQLGVAHFVVREPGALIGSLAKVEALHGVRVLARQDRAGRRIPWSPTAELASGDAIAVLGTLPALEAFRRAYPAGGPAERAPSETPGLPAAPTTSETIILCGLGRSAIASSSCSWRGSPTCGSSWCTWAGTTIPSCAACVTWTASSS